MAKVECINPNYSNSILNLITSIAKNYGVDSDHSTLQVVDEYLAKKYKNIVLLVMDGMGDRILTTISAEGILNKNKVDVITSVFPSTTTSAMTTFYSGLAPIEHGCLGWSLYFKEFGRYIDYLPCTDSYTKELFYCENGNPYEILKYKTIYEKIDEATNGKVNTYKLCQKPYIKNETFPRTSVEANDIKAMSDVIVSLCQNNESKYIFGYYDSPDILIHKYGCYSEETTNFIKEIEVEIESMCKKLQGTDTLLIITADHGHIDIDNAIAINEIPELQECLNMPPFLESRCVSFFVKSDKMEIFKERFNKLFEGAFELYTKSKFLELGFLGDGVEHSKIDDFVGDYIALAIGTTRIKLNIDLSKSSKPKLATHCGLTKNEMEVPLIVFDFKV